MQQSTSFSVLRSRKATTANQENLSRTIILSVKSGDVAETEDLINKGADIDVTENGNNLLLLAIVYDQKDVARLLVARGINLNYRSQGGDDRTQYRSALDLTEEKGWDDLYELIERTSLANKNIPMAVVDGDTKLTKSLLEQGADINTVTDTGESLLMRAIRHGHWEVSELLISQGIDVAYVLVQRHQSANGKIETTKETARIYASKYGMPDIIQLIDRREGEYRQQGIIVQDPSEADLQINEKKPVNEDKTDSEKQRSHTCAVL